MNPHVKKKWLEALRERKIGNEPIQQGIGLLKKNSNQYCCLGVLCELYRIEQNNGIWKETIDLEGNSCFEIFDSFNYLPYPVKIWAELPEGNPRIPEHGRLAYLNDKPMSFDEIANLIEEYL